MKTTSLAVLVSLAAACSSDNKSVALSDTADALHEAVCQWFTRCGEVPDVASCMTGNIGLTFHISPSVQAMVDMGKAKYDGAKMASCIAAFANRSCDQTSESFRDFFMEKACIEALVGTVSAGGECASNDECISRNCSVPSCTSGCCTGSCVGDTPPPLTGQIGASCCTSAGALTCASGSFCDFNSNTCTALASQGAPCSDSYQCAYGLACFGTNTMTCQPAPALGDACTQGVCRDIGTACIAGTCARVQGVGAACGDSSQCDGLLSCNGTTCAERASLGGACSSDFDCGDYRAYCDTTCKAPLADGNACLGDYQCDSDSCNATTQTCGPDPVCT